VAFKLFEQVANQGEGGASWRLGEMCTNGTGVKQDLEKAEYWYQKALSQGYLPAKESLMELKKKSSNNL
jgi:TPR repeat protein